MTVRYKLTLMILSFISLISLVVNQAEAQSQERIKTCVSEALWHVLRADQISHYIAITNIAQNIAGRQIQTLDPPAVRDFTNTVEQVMTNELKDYGKDYLSITPHSISATPSSQYTGRLVVKGKLDNYSFTTIAKISPTECLFYTLNIEEAFTLSSWLKDHPDIKSKMKELGLKS